MAMEIKRITKVDSELANQINLILDEGTTWDKHQGDLFTKNPDNLLLLAFEDNKPVGFLTAHRLQRFDKRRAEVLLYEMGVGQDYRKKGIGKALIEECKIWAKEIGADEVWVLTEKDNIPAMAMYQATGAKEEASGTIMWVYKIKQ